MADNWSRGEVEESVEDYFDMLAKELRGETFNKAEHNRRLQSILPKRTRGSIERKHQNISAILIEVGYPYLNGYKPLGNYQDLLRVGVEQRLAGARQLQQAAQDAVEQPVLALPAVPDILSILVPAPVREDKPLPLGERPPVIRKLVKRNYLELEARNRSLGDAGEGLVIRFEHERLWRAGKHRLAERIEHVTQTQGDHLGYDIVSFDDQGREQLIEVKTTRFGSLTPFFASRNEVNVSETRDDDYLLYRLFHFGKEPRLFVLNGSLRRSCILEPSQFAGSPR